LGEFRHSSAEKRMKSRKMRLRLCECLRLWVAFGLWLFRRAELWLPCGLEKDWRRSEKLNQASSNFEL
jgi:hypothetical protein